MNEQIRVAAYAAARGEISVPGASGYCLSFVRRVVEAALFGGRVEFYDRYLVAETSKRTGKDRGNARSDPWAADVEASMKYLSYSVPFAERQAGDLIFNHKGAAPVGHVAVLLEPNLVLENINESYRPKSIHLGRHLSQTPIEHFPTTLIARLQER